MFENQFNSILYMNKIQNQITFIMALIVSLNDSTMWGSDLSAINKNLS